MDNTSRFRNTFGLFEYDNKTKKNVQKNLSVQMLHIFKMWEVLFEIRLTNNYKCFEKLIPLPFFPN